MKYLNQLGMSRYSVSARIIRRGIQVTKNSKEVSSKDSQNNRENFGVSCNNKINWEAMNGEYTWLSIGVYLRNGIAKAMP